jgi:hypothetical protein
MRFKKLPGLVPPFQPFRKVEPNPPFSESVGLSKGGAKSTFRKGGAKCRDKGGAKI